MKLINLNTFVLKGVITLLVVCLLIAPPAWGQSGRDYILEWSTIDGGGGRSAGGDFVLTGTIGQPDAGEMSGGNYQLSSGFWVGGPVLSCFVNFEDFAEFAIHWLDTPCSDGNNWCGGVDLDFSGDVTVTDLSEVAYFWLCACPEDWPLK